MYKKIVKKVRKITTRKEKKEGKKVTAKKEKYPEKKKKTKKVTTKKKEKYISTIPLFIFIEISIKKNVLNY